MKRFMGTIKGKGIVVEERRKSDVVLPQGDSPEAIVAREVTAFCESGGPNTTNAGDEYLHLPAIVDAAESSPAAASEAAKRIRKFISKENHHKAYAQYNAIMLTRILTDNPAERFTRNFDAKFVTTTKELLREGRDMSVQQILRETLDYFETEKVAGNPSLVPLMEMWKQEKSRAGGRLHNNNNNNNALPGPRTMNAPPFNQQQQQQQHTYFSRPNNRTRGLPPADELVARIEEAKTTARLLLQTIQSTPSSEILSNDLIKEFAERAAVANRSIQGYINADDPPPDEDTMLTLIETNEQLSVAISKHQRALLQARKAIGATPSPQPQAPPGQNGYSQQHSQPQGGQDIHPPQPSPAQPRQNTYTTPASLPHRAEQEAYIPPLGPPAGAIGAIRINGFANNNAYSSPPPIPARSWPMFLDHPTPTRTLDYGVAENPFADTHPEPQISQQPQQLQQKSYSLFDRPSQTTPPSPQASTQYSEEPEASSSKQVPMQKPYEPYNPGYRLTPSYIDRQDSAANNLTMHGASPPPAQGQPERMGRLPGNSVDKAMERTGRTPDNSMNTAKERTGRTPDNSMNTARERTGRTPDNSMNTARERTGRTPNNSMNKAKEQTGRTPDNSVDKTKERTGRTPGSFVEKTKDVRTLMGSMRAWM